ncbi:MAG: hypothetical protein OR997_02370 [Methylophilaceae bacterium]|nr:hypothetical protein [Methylophilaceae bacterium]
MRFIIVLFSLSLTCLAVANTPSTQLSAEKPSAKQVDIQTLALQKQYLQTIDCRGADQLISILKKSLDQTEDLSAKGHIASVFEEVVMNNPSCFIQASNALPVKVCDQVEAQFIHETFFLSTR